MPAPPRSAAAAASPSHAPPPPDAPPAGARREARHAAPRLARAPLALATLLVLVHLAVNARTPYGWHRDELLYVAMGRHLRLWAMDFPPFIALAANAARATLGETVPALRLAPAIAGSLLVLLVAHAARRLGAGAAMQTLAALVVALGPVFLAAANLFQPVVFDQLWWTAALVALGERAHGGGPRWWIAVGAALGLGLLTKFSVAFVAAGITLAVLLTPLRRDLAGPWPWAGAALALLLGAPSVVGQLRLGWPVRAQMADLQATQLALVSPWAFVAGQPLVVGPAVALGALGTLWLLVGRAARERPARRALALAPVAALALLALGRGKPYYGAPAWPVLAAAGAAALAHWSWPRARRLVAAGLALAALGLAVVAGPLVLPVLPPAQGARWAARLAPDAARTTNHGRMLALPQDQADMIGWHRLARTTAAVVAALPPAERGRAVVKASNYGQAAALEHYASAFALPPVVSDVGSFWFFGPGSRPGDPLVLVGEEPHEPAPFFAECRLAARTTNPWGVPEERDVPITVCRGARTTLQALWPTLRGRQ